MATHGNEKLRQGMAAITGVVQVSVHHRADLPAGHNWISYIPPCHLEHPCKSPLKCNTLAGELQSTMETTFHFEICFLMISYWENHLPIHIPAGYISVAFPLPLSFVDSRQGLGTFCTFSFTGT